MSDRSVVKQDYKLVNAKYKLNPNEIKLIMHALTEINTDDTDFKFASVPIEHINQEFASKQNRARLKKFCEDLFKKPLNIHTDNGFLLVHWFASLEYKGKEGVIEYEISEKLKPYLLDLKERFVKYNLKYILPMQSSYAIRIYQLCKEREKMEKFLMPVAELQEILQVPKSLKTYANFKNKVIKVAQKELTQYGDVFFEYEEVKTGRKVTDLLFRVKKNNYNEVDKPTLF